MARCEISKKKAKKRLVIASYGPTAQRQPDDQPEQLGRPVHQDRQGQAPRQGQGPRRHGDPDRGLRRPHLPSCTSTKIFLFLTWRTNGVFYQAISFGESRSTLVGFARSLVRV